MAGEVKIQGSDQGFITVDGSRLKTKEELATDSKKQDQKQVESAVQDDTKSLSNAMGSVKRQFNEEVQAVANSIAEDEAVLKRAKKVVKDQEKTLSDLKTAMKEGDEKSISEAREKLSKLGSEAKKIEKDVASVNEARVTERRKSISFGNEQLGTIQTKEIKFKAVDTSSLDTKSNIAATSKALKESSDSLSEQRAELKETKNELKDISAEADKKISDISGAPVRAISEAERLAQDVAKQIKSAAEASGGAALSQVTSTFQSLNPAQITTLLQGG